MAQEEGITAAAKLVKFKRHNSVVTCECGKFSIDLLVPTAEIQQKVVDHARTHGLTSISIIDEF